MHTENPETLFGRCELCNEDPVSHIWFDEPGQMYWVVCPDCSQNKMELREDQRYIGKLDRSTTDAERRGWEEWTGRELSKSDTFDEPAGGEQ